MLNVKCLVFIEFNSKFIIYNFLLLTSVLAVAQPKAKPKEDEDIVVVSNDFIKNDKTILLKWFSTDFVPKDGYNVYRKLANGGNWEKINKEPVKLNKTIPTNLLIDSEEKKYWEAAQKLTPQDMSKAGMLIGYTYLKVINSMDFAELMGMAYRDNTVEAGQEYVYMVKTLKGTNEILVDTSLVIKQASWEPIKAISKINVERKRKEIQLKFAPEIHRYYAFDVERKPIGSSEFKKLFQAPSLLQRDENGEWPAAPFIDTKIHKDTAYVYVIYGIDYFGRKTKPSAELFVQKKDFDPPKPVTDLVFDQDTLRVHLSWKPSVEKDEDLKGYLVYRSQFYDKDYEKVTPSYIPLSKNEYTDKVPGPGEYYYMVVSVDKNENESGGAAIMADIRDVVAPEKPSGLKAIADSGKVKISWIPNIEKDLKGYIVYKSIAGKNVFVPVNGDPIKDNFYQEKLAKQVKNRFVYKVLAIDSGYNRSKYSDSVSIKLPDIVSPAIPIIKKIEASSEKGLRIEWLQSVDNDLSIYQIYRTETSTKNPQPKMITSVNSKAKEFIDVTAEKNKNYNYTMLSIDSSGNKSGFSNPYPFKWLDSKTTMNVASFNLKPNTKDKKITLSWKIEKGNHFKSIVLFRAFNNEEMSQHTGNLGDQIEYTDSKLAYGKYTYCIKLYDTLGNVIKSQERIITLEPDVQK